MTRKRIPCTLSSRVIGPSSHSGSLGRVRTLGKIRPMAFFFVHGKCQHYYESGQSSAARRVAPDSSPGRDGPALVRITFLCPHVRIAGGVRAILTYANRLAGRGHRVTVLVPADGRLRALGRRLRGVRPDWLPSFRAPIEW